MSSSAQESVRHHYVPEFLLDKWVVPSTSNQRTLNAYYWDPYRNEIRCKSNKGPRYYCYKKGLLTFDKPHPKGEDAIEAQFFREIDNKGARVRDVLIQNGTGRLTVDERCDWARLLLSLDARRPEIVEKLKNDGPDFLRKRLNTSRAIQEVMADYDLTGSPAEYYESSTGISFQDASLAVIQQIVDNPKVGKKLINAHWHIRHLSDNAQPLILSDRPLIRKQAYDSPDALWVLPLSPRIVFVAANHREKLNDLLNIGHRQFSKELNKLSAKQADKYVFSISVSHEECLKRYLRKVSIDR